MPEDRVVEPIKRTRLGQQIVLEICRLIRRGQLESGDALPPERELAEQLGVSRASLREALRGLEAVGMVETRHGGGTYVRDFADFGIESPLAMVLETSSDFAGDLSEARIIFEPPIAARAARKATPDDIAIFDDILAKQRTIVNSPGNKDVFIELDRQFHTAIAEASRNIVAVRVVQLLNKLLFAERRYFVTSSDRCSQAFAWHITITDAIREGNPEASHEAMRAHLQEVEDSIFSEVIESRFRETVENE